MHNRFFEFRQFTVDQENCAMKVGTDGVLLGAWFVGRFASTPRRVLDVGTGTGLLALMAAQQWPDATVDAIDIDAAAAGQAAGNVAASPWPERIRVHHIALADFVPQAAATGMAYDAIVCNPPYHNGTLKPADATRATARHADAMPWATLFASMRRLLAPRGRACIICPTTEWQTVSAELIAAGLDMQTVCHVVTRQGQQPKRMMLELVAGRQGDVTNETITLNDAHGRTAQYSTLTRAFYIR